MAQRLLDLSTIDPERPLIAVDGMGYELQLPDDFGLLELARLQRLQTTVAEVMGRTGDLQDGDIDALARSLDGFVALVLPGLPADAMHRLKDAQKLAIIGAFRKAAGERGNPESLMSPPTGAS